MERTNEKDQRRARVYPIGPFLLTSVPEATARIIVRGDAVRKIIIVWDEHRIDEKGDVVGDKKVKNPWYGGWRFFGYWPLDKIYSYDFRWRDVQLVQGTEKSEFHEKVIDYIFLKPDVYWTEILNAETMGRPEKGEAERIPVNLQFLITMRVVNPYKALFVAPSNWNENVMIRINSLFRGWVGGKKVDEIIAISIALKVGKSPVSIWEELKDNPVIKLIEDEWGIKIEDNGIQIRDVGFSPEYQSALAAERKAQLETKGKIAETVGAFIEMVSQETGFSGEDIKKEIKNDAKGFVKKYQQIIDRNWDIIYRKMAIEGKAYVDIRTTGSDSTKAIIDIIAAWQRMPKGGLQKQTGWERTKQTKLTDEERDRRIREKANMLLTGERGKKDKGESEDEETGSS